MKATDFSLPDQTGKIHKLSDYKGKWVALYFYPKDDTPGCTKEACGFRDSSLVFKEKGVVVLGVSKDSVASHQKFAEKYHLSFPILSDVEGKVIKDYKAQGIFTKRITYIINPKGGILKIYKKVDPLIHAGEILKDIQ
jgi:thioredoxin-dependent peroxiredoxin